MSDKTAEVMAVVAEAIDGAVAGGVGGVLVYKRADGGLAFVACPVGSLVRANVNGERLGIFQFRLEFDSSTEPHRDVAT